MHEFVPRKPFSCLAATNMLNPQLYVKNSSLQFFSIPQCTFTKLLAILNAGNQHVMVLKVSWIKILFIKLTNSSKHSLMLAKTGIEMHLMHEFMSPEPFLVFQQRTCPIRYFRSKTHVLGGFAPFRRRTRPIAETSIGVHLIECFRIVGLQTYYVKDFNALLQVQN